MEGAGRLCRSTRRNWPYQGASEIAKKLKRSLVNNYKAWKENNHDGHCRALNVILSGAGTGKSRMLDNMKSLLCGAAKLSKDEDLMARMESAYVFRITFADGPEQDSQLIDDIYGDLDISYRMIYQLYKHKREVAWPLFVSKLKGVYSKTVFFHRRGASLIGQAGANRQASGHDGAAVRGWPRQASPRRDQAVLEIPPCNERDHQLPERFESIRRLCVCLKARQSFS